VTPTGSLRTRAPELISELEYRGDPFKIDIWALGATVYNYVVGRYPLIREREPVPRLSDPTERTEFEKILKTRVEKEWEHYVDLSLVPDPLRNLLSDLLAKDPAVRISSVEVLHRCDNELVAFLRSSEQASDFTSAKFSALEEFGQIEEYLAIPNIVTLVPANRKQKLSRRLSDLRRMAGFDEDIRRRIDLLLSSLT